MAIKKIYHKKLIKKFKTISVVDFNNIKSHINWISKNRVNAHNPKMFPMKLVVFDFKYAKHLKPYHIAPLACLIHEYQAKGFKIRITNMSNQINSYLQSFNFEQFCNNEHRNDFSCSDPKTFPLWRIEESRVSFYADHVQKYFEQNHFGGKTLFSLSISLAELMNNIFDHSMSKIPGYTFTQYNSTTNSIITCVCDFGVGIPKKINSYLKKEKEPTLDNLEALIKAFEQHFSTRSTPRNRGFGLDNILSVIKELNSKLLVISNNALYRILPDNITERTLLEENFPGTLFVTYLNTSNLPACEEELTEEMSLIEIL